MDGSVRGRLRAWLRWEGGAAFLGFCGLYAVLPGERSWWLFAALFLVPDISFAAYWLGSRAGATAYNAFHSYVGCWVLGAAGLWSGTPACITLALIWAAHIGFDRMLGYGLKDASGFHDTHLGRIGRAKPGMGAA